MTKNDDYYGDDVNVYPQEQDSVVSEWEQYLKQFKLVEGRLWELPVESSRSKRRELRNMVRRGIPRQYRCQMWGRLAAIQEGGIY